MSEDPKKTPIQSEVARVEHHGPKILIIAKRNFATSELIEALGKSLPSLFIELAPRGVTSVAFVIED